jgi:serine/threonine protein kinase
MRSIVPCAATRALIQQLLAVDPNRRPTIHELLAHPWMYIGFEHQGRLTSASTLPDDYDHEVRACGGCQGAERGLAARIKSLSSAKWTWELICTPAHSLTHILQSSRSVFPSFHIIKETVSSHDSDCIYARRGTALRIMPCRLNLDPFYFPH